MGDFAVILTHDRPDALARCVAAVGPQVDAVVIVDNASDPPVPVTGWQENVACLYIPDQPPNLARLWNKALDRIEATWPVGAEWNVAFLCDDVAIPTDWFARVRDGMRAHRCVAASAHSIAPADAAAVKTQPDNDIFGRMHGAAFMLAGEKGLRADESMHWWWIDDDLDRQARLAGGMVIVPGPVAVNQLPNDWTNRKPELAEQAGRDREAFAVKWGGNPW